MKRTLTNAEAIRRVMGIDRFSLPQLVAVYASIGIFVATALGIRDKHGPARIAVTSVIVTVWVVVLGLALRWYLIRRERDGQNPT